MNAYLPGLIGALWALCAAVLIWGVVDALRKGLGGDGSLPWFDQLARRGLTPVRAEQAVGAEQLARAVRRCVLCRERAACSAGQPVDCPNASTLERLTFARIIE